MKNFLKKNSKTLKGCLSLDFFKIQQEIPFYGKKSYSSLLGVSFSYLQLLITCFAFFYFGKELIIKENPNLIITENRLPLDNYYQLDFEKDEFLLNFGVLENKQLKPIDETYFKVFGEHKTFVLSNKNGELSVRTIIFELENCTPDYLKKSFGQSISTEELQYYSSIYYCFSNKIRDVKYSDNFPEDKKGNASHMAIKGFFGSKEFSFINIKFSRCVNKTNQTYPGILFIYHF